MGRPGGSIQHLSTFTLNVARQHYLGKLNDCVTLSFLPYVGTSNPILSFCLASYNGYNSIPSCNQTWCAGKSPHLLIFRVKPPFNSRISSHVWWHQMVIFILPSSRYIHDTTIVVLLTLPFDISMNFPMVCEIHPPWKHCCCARAISWSLGETVKHRAGSGPPSDGGLGIWTNENIDPTNCIMWVKTMP